MWWLLIIVMVGFGIYGLLVPAPPPQRIDPSKPWVDEFY